MSRWNRFIIWKLRNVKDDKKNVLELLIGEQKQIKKPLFNYVCMKALYRKKGNRKSTDLVNQQIAKMKGIIQNAIKKQTTFSDMKNESMKKIC